MRFPLFCAQKKEWVHKIFFSAIPVFVHRAIGAQRERGNTCPFRFKRIDIAPSPRSTAAPAAIGTTKTAAGKPLLRPGQSLGDQAQPRYELTAFSEAMVPACTVPYPASMKFPFPVLKATWPKLRFRSFMAKKTRLPRLRGRGGRVKVCGHTGEEEGGIHVWRYLAAQLPANKTLIRKEEGLGEYVHRANPAARGERVRRFSRGQKKLSDANEISSKPPPSGGFVQRSAAWRSCRSEASKALAPLLGTGLRPKLYFAYFKS
jgi:hypothetical protein